jgi:acetyl/propionyl-CoA carboxylase alpha subunit
LPATGTVQALQQPSGPGVRVDSGMYAGLQVPLFYDPLLSKLIVWGKDRAHAIARMRRALDEYSVIGVRTTLPFARWLMEHPRYLAGDMSTDFIAEEWDTRNAATPASPPDEGENGVLAPEQIAALVGGILLNEHVEEEKLRRKPAGENGTETSRWRDAARRDALRRM